MPDFTLNDGLGILDLKLRIVNRSDSRIGAAAGRRMGPEPRDRPEHGYHGPRALTVPAPRRVDGAEWQPAVTPRADAVRPTLDGEPVPGALAASVTRGWVYVAPLDLLQPPCRGVVRLLPVCPRCR